MGQIEHFGIRLTLGILFTLCLVVFLIPIYTGRIVNLGNLAGGGVSAFFLLCTLFYPRVKLLLERLTASTGGRVFWHVLVGLFCAGVLLCLVISGFMLHAAHQQPTQEPDAIIVLGCKVRGDHPSRMLRQRLDAAYAYLETHPDVIVVVSGGQGSDEIMTEAESMYAYLVDKGIDPDRILREDQSTNTKENLAFSKALLEQNGMKSANVTIVSHEFHLLRAGMIAEDVNIDDPSVIAAHTDWWLLPTYVVREWFAVVAEFFR